MDEAVDECMDEVEDAHPYKVKAQEPLQEAAEPLRFDRLPCELQSEVLKRTHARFEVTHHMEVGQSALGLCPTQLVFIARTHFGTQNLAV
jgi:hypothetical protein